MFENEKERKLGNGIMVFSWIAVAINFLVIWYKPFRQALPGALASVLQISMLAVQVAGFTWMFKKLKITGREFSAIQQPR